MGFAIYYRSTSPVDAETALKIKRAAYQACHGKTWLSCEPVSFYMQTDDGHLSGSSKPNFSPHPKDVASAAAENLPDGTLSDLLEILCGVSKSFGVDWAFRHDHDPGPIGFIRGGVAEADLRDQIEVFAELCGALGDLDSDLDLDSLGIHEKQDSDDDGEPHTIKFPGQPSGPAQSYENQHFGLRIDIPRAWTIESWRHSKIPGMARLGFQMQDDDLPVEGGSKKFLFAAQRCAAGSNLKVEAEVQFSVRRLSGNENMKSVLNEAFALLQDYFKSKDMQSAIVAEGVLTILGVEFGYLDQELSGPVLNSTTRFIFRQIEDTLWFEGKIAGYGPGFLEDALEVLSRLDWYGARRGEAK